MDIPYTVKFINCCKHLADVKSSVLLLENARVIEQRSKIASGHVFHGKIHEFGILKRVQESHEPRSLSGG